MSKQRQYGYYWVKFMNTWVIATWFPEHHFWLVHHTGSSRWEFPESTIEEVNENPIPTPDEMAQQINWNKPTATQVLKKIDERVVVKLKELLEIK